MPRGRNRLIVGSLVPKTQADKFIENTMKLRRIGPDTPIEWDAFGTSEQGGENGMPVSSPGGIVPTVSAGQHGVVNKQRVLDDLITQALMIGFPYKEFSATAKRKKGNGY